MDKRSGTAQPSARDDRLVQIELQWHRCAEQHGANAATAQMAGALYEAEEKLRAIRALVDEQAEDEALWALNLDGSLPISEAYLQQELRRLHALIEAKDLLG